MRHIILLVLFGASIWQSAAQAATLERLRETGVLTVGYREDAAPYSFKNPLGEPDGYTVDLCRALALELKQQLDLEEISLDYVPVTAENRFDAVQSGQIDLLCGAATETLSRREQVDFSQPIFIDGASVMFTAQGPASFGELVGRKIGVRAGTTTEDVLKASLAKEQIAAETVAVSDHKEGLALLEAGEISAYFADQAILIFLAAGSKSSADLRVSERFFTYEPYALALTRGDSDFRLAVDRGLSRIYRSGLIDSIFVKSFGVATPSPILRAMFLISALPE